MNYEFGRYSLSFLHVSVDTNMIEWSPVIICFPSYVKSTLKLFTNKHNTIVLRLSLWVQRAWVCVIYFEGIVDISNGDFCGTKYYFLFCQTYSQWLRSSRDWCRRHRWFYRCQIFFRAWTCGHRIQLPQIFHWSLSYSNQSWSMFCPLLCTVSYITIVYVNIPIMRFIQINIILH